MKPAAVLAVLVVVMMAVATHVHAAHAHNPLQLWTRQAHTHMQAVKLWNNDAVACIVTFLDTIESKLGDWETGFLDVMKTQVSPLCVAALETNNQTIRAAVRSLEADGEAHSTVTPANCAAGTIYTCTQTLHYTDALQRSTAQWLHDVGWRLISYDVDMHFAFFVSYRSSVSQMDVHNFTNNDVMAFPRACTAADLEKFRDGITATFTLINTVLHTFTACVTAATPGMTASGDLTGTFNYYADVDTTTYLPTRAAVTVSASGSATVSAAPKMAAPAMFTVAALLAAMMIVCRWSSQL